VPTLLDRLFKRLSLPVNHGPLLVEHVLGYLAASREGLAENEILEILFTDPKYKATLNQATKETQHEMPANAKRIPIAIWSRLRFDLAYYLTERAATGANVLTFYHRQVAEWVQEHIANKTDQSWQPHLLLANYFCDLADPAKDQSWKGECPRPCREVVYHMIRCERHVEASRLLADLTYLDARISLVGRVNDLFTDYDDLRSLDHNVLEGWQRFLLRHASRLNRYPNSLFSVACLEGTDQVAAAARQMVDAGCWPKPWISARRIYTVDAKQENSRNDRTRSLDVIAENSATIGPTAAIAPEAGIALVSAGHATQDLSMVNAHLG